MKHYEHQDNRAGQQVTENRPEDQDLFPKTTPRNFSKPNSEIKQPGTDSSDLSHCSCQPHSCRGIHPLPAQAPKQRSWRSCSTGLRSTAKVCRVHPGQGKTLLRQLRGSSHTPAVMPAWGLASGPEQRQHPALQTSPVYISVFHISHPSSLCTGHLCFLPVPGNAGTGDQQQRLEASAAPGHASAAALSAMGAQEPPKTDTVSDPNRQKSRWIFKKRFVCKP